MSNFLKNRESTRDFKKKRMDERTRVEVLEIFKDIEHEVEDKYFNFLLYEDGDMIFEKFDGLGGYDGNMIESPYYIGIRLQDSTEENIIKASYYGEKLISLLAGQNLGTCWVSIKEVNKDLRAKVLGIENKNIAYLIAVGYPKAKNPFTRGEDSSRLGLKDLVFKEEIGKAISTRELESRGLDDLFYYIRFAPSNLNLQPWRFVLEGDKVKLFLKYCDEGNIDLMSAGIIMYYFKAMGRSIGLMDEWVLLDKLDVEYANEKYKFIGEILL